MEDQFYKGYGWIYIMILLDLVHMGMAVASIIIKAQKKY